MLISHSKKFIFIHIYKTAGTSISSGFAPYAHSIFSRRNRLQSWLGMKPALYSEDFNKHISAQLLKEQLPQKYFSNYFKFCFVRNPWDWQVSLYHYVLSDKDNQHHEIIKSLGSFDRYIQWRVENNLVLQVDLITDNQGKLLVDFIGKVENIETDVNYIKDHLGIESVSIPFLNKSNRTNYQDYYSLETRELVRKAYAKDIESFGYDF